MRGGATTFPGSWGTSRPRGIAIHVRPVPRQPRAVHDPEQRLPLRRIGPDNPRSHDVMHADRVSQPPCLFSPTVCLWLEGAGMRARGPSGRSRVGSNRVKSGRWPDLTFDRNLNDNKRIWSRIGPSRQIGRLKTSRANGRPVRASLSRSTSPGHASTRFAELTCLLIVRPRDGQISSSWSSRVGDPT